MIVSNRLERMRVRRAERIIRHYGSIWKVEKRLGCKERRYFGEKDRGG